MVVNSQSSVKSSINLIPHFWPVLMTIDLRSFFFASCPLWWWIWAKWTCGKAWKRSFCDYKVCEALFIYRATMVSWCIIGIFFFWGGGEEMGWHIVMYMEKWRQPCKSGWTNRATVWDGEWSEPKEFCGVHIGATWQIRLNDCVRLLWVDLPPATATRHFPKLLVNIIMCTSNFWVTGFFM